MGLFDFLRNKSKKDIANDDTTLRMAQEDMDRKKDVETGEEPDDRDAATTEPESENPSTDTAPEVDSAPDTDSSGNLDD